MGIPHVYDLVPASTDKRLAAESLIDHLSESDILTEKGFMGKEWQTKIHQQMGNLSFTPKHNNPYVQNPDWLDNLINR